MHTRSRSRATLVGAGLLLAFGIQHGAAGATIHRTAVGTSAGIPNVRVSHDRYPDHAEPALAVNPRDPHNLLGTAMDFDRSPTPGTFVSFDGGKTWHDNGALPLPAGFTQGGDVSVAFTAQGTGFVAAEALSGLNADVRGVYVWRTDDGGRTFQRPVAVVSGQFVDHPWLAGGTAPSPGSGALYVAWVTRPGAGRTQTEGLAFSRSLDGGHSFTAPRIISAPPGGITAPVVAAGPAGAVYVAYVTVGRGRAAASQPHARPRGDRAAGAPAGGRTLDIEVVASADHGRHFARPTVPGPAVFGLVPAPGILVATGPSLATDSRDGAVYVAYTAYRPGTTHADIMLARSRNSGRTWSAPLRITNGPLTDKAVYCQPQVVVDDAGAVAVSYFALAHGRVDVFLARSATHGARRGVSHTPFGPPQQITSRSFDPALGLPGGKEGLWWIGDYQGLAAGPGMFHPLWSDTRTGHLEIFTAALPGE